MATRVEIYNLALYKLAQSIGVPTINDESKAADVLNMLWNPMRQLVLTERVWPWAMAWQALALTAEPVQPGWALRYAYPNNCLTAYAVTNEGGLANAGSLSKFASKEYLQSVWGTGAYDWDTGYGADSTIINTNVTDALLVYCVDVEDPTRFPPQFVNALATRLAAEAAPPIIGDIGLQNKEQLLREYNLALTNAGAHAMNEANTTDDYMTPALAARGW